VCVIIIFHHVSPVNWNTVQHEFTTGLPPPPPTDEGFHIIRTQYAHAPRGSTYIQSTDYIPTQPQDQLTVNSCCTLCQLTGET